MKKFNYIEAAKKIFEIESRVVSELSDQLDESYRSEEHTSELQSH